MRFFHRAILSVSLLISLSACANDTISEKNSAARALWNESGISSYQYHYEVGCFCSGPAVGGATITVIDGMVVSAELEDREATPAELDGLPAIEQLFADIDNIVAEEPHDIAVIYDPTYGYPTELDVDPIANAIDDEMMFKVTSFSALSVD